ncbi:MAG: glycerate kinase [Betaproteobacteria bacterium]|nr:glycerate kinase [Betaproteobacteria bacterium]MDH5220841.1 glycerate kinase [Betaproteobacteria bacterium]MDH5349829.1 glycerate kinase [Betaproteobacteria bacterium]
MRALLEESFRAAVSAADPLLILPAHLPPPPRGRTFVAAAGKAAASMALAVERHWPRAAPLDGLAITRYAHGLPTERIRVIEAGHPVPDTAGEGAARTLLAEVRKLGPDDLLLALVSGGGSSLLSLPAPGVPMEGLKAMTRALLRCGAPIQEMNTVRKHLSAIQGGRLAAACRAPVLALVISDVTGDDPTHIASGPCAPDPTTVADARAVLEKYGIAAPGEFSETPKPGDPLFARVENRVIATARQSLEAAAAVFAARGYPPTIFGDDIMGEAREVARDMAAQARAARRPCVLISGGECTVTVRGQGGRGGRCAEFLLALAIALEGVPGAHAIAADTDGIDGSEDNAGALMAPDTLARARTRRIEPQAMLEANDSYGFFGALGDLLVTGPTRTNVNDYRAILLEQVTP